MSNEFFQNTLSSLAMDVAVGDAVRSLAARGFSPSEIKRHLDYPVSDEKLGQMIWKCLTENGTILMRSPEEDAGAKHTYVTDRNAYGTTSYRRVEATSEAPAKAYVPCDFGKRMYKDREGFMKEMGGMLPEDIDYILGLPWPLSTVWHVADERMQRINTHMKKE